jgi:hypothetical protein
VNYTNIFLENKKIAKINFMHLQNTFHNINKGQNKSISSDECTHLNNNSLNISGYHNAQNVSEGVKKTQYNYFTKLNNIKLNLDNNKKSTNHTIHNTQLNTLNNAESNFNSGTATNINTGLNTNLNTNTSVNIKPSNRNKSIFKFKQEKPLISFGSIKDSSCLNRSTSKIIKKISHIVPIQLGKIIQTNHPSSTKNILMHKSVIEEKKKTVRSSNFISQVKSNQSNSSSSNKLINKLLGFDTLSLKNFNASNKNQHKMKKK